jgi:hypothetical protein
MRTESDAHFQKPMRVAIAGRQGMAVSVIALIVLSTACVSQVEVKAANTGIPVLLSRIDRINSPNPQAGCFSGGSKGQKAIDVKVAHTSIIAAPYASTEAQDASAVVDATILATTLGNPETNVCVDSLTASTRAVYWVFGVLDRTMGWLKAHPETAQKGDK